MTNQTDEKIYFPLPLNLILFFVLNKCMKYNIKI